MKSFPRMLALVAAIQLSAAPALFAGAEHGHSHDHAHRKDRELAIPESREALWAAIRSAHADLAKAVESRTADAAYEAEETLQAYLKALPRKLADADAEARKRIEGQIRNLARAYDAIHHAVEDGNWDKAALDVKKADGAFRVFAAQLAK